MKFMGQKLGFLPDRRFVHPVFSLLFLPVLVFAFIFHMPFSEAITLSFRGFHSSNMLSSASLSNLSPPVPTSPSSLWLNSSGNEIQEDEILYHFYRNGRSKRDYRKPTTRFMVNLFNELQKGQVSQKEHKSAVTDTIRSFTGESRTTKRNGKPVINYHIPYLPYHEILKYAEIRFLVNQTANDRSQNYKFRIRVKKNGKTVKKVTLRERSVLQDQYNIFDVTTVVSPWVNSYHGNISLHVKLSKKLQSRATIKSEDKLQSTSFIALYLEDREFLKNMYSSLMSPGENETELTHMRLKRGVRENGEIASNDSMVRMKTPDTTFSRTKRGATKRRRRNRKVRKWYKGGRKENCKLYDFEVDFNTIGWGQWIIHPKRFNSRFCFGICPSPVDKTYKPTNHAMLQTLMRMKRPNLAPAPCCVPIKLNPVSMLYFEYDEIVVRHHDDMVAEECGCR